MTDEQKCLEWLKNRRDNTPMAGAKKMFSIAIFAMEKQTADKCCETCRHKYGSQQESPCCDCYLATAYEDCYEAEEEES